MSTGLQEKPSSIYDDENRRAKETADLRALEDDFAEPAIADEDRNAGGSSTTAKDLKKSEETKDDKLKDSADKSKGSDSSSSDGGSGDGGGFYKKTKTRAKNNIVGSLSNTRAKIFMAIAVAIISAFSVLLTMGPGFLMNQLKEMLLGRISNVQMYHQRRYRQKNIHKLRNMWSADGRKAQKIVDEMTARGYKFSFDKDGNINGLKHPLKETSAIGEGIGKEFDDFLETRHPLRTARWKTKRTEALWTTFKVKRTSPIDADKIRAGPDGDVDVKQIVNSEMAEGILEGEDLDLKVASTTGKDADATAQANRDANAAEYEEAAGEIGDDAKKAADDLKAGKSVDELSDSFRGIAKSGGFLNDEVAQIAEQAAQGSVGGKIASTAKGLANPLDLADRLCMIRNRVNGAVFLARQAKTVKLIRYSMLFVNAADDTRRGRADSKAVNELMQRLTAKDDNGQYVGGSPGFAYMMKSRFSKSKNDASKSPVAVDGKLSGFMGSVHQGTSRVGGIDGACPFVQNPATQVVAGVASVAAAIFTGGGSGAAQVATTTAMKEAVKKAVREITVRQVLIAVGRTLAVELSFEAIMTLTEIYIQKELNVPFTGQEKGGQLGDILVAGVGASNKQRSLQAGMVPATTQQYAAANNEYLAWKKEEDGKKSFTERAFAIDNPDSLTFNLAMAVPWNAGNAVGEGFNQSLNVASSALNPSKVLTSFMTSVSPKASALDGDEISFDSYEIKGGSANGVKLATDPAGNPQVIMRSDIEAIEPIANRDALVTAGEIDSTTYQPKEGSDFAEHVELCVTAADSYTNIEDNKGDCLASGQQAKKFKAHLAFLDLTDGLDAEFSPEEIDTATSTPSAPSAPTGSNTGGAIVGDPYADTTEVPCAEGTKDIGVQDAYRDGKPFKSRMCSLPNFPSSGQSDNPGGRYSTPGADGHAIVNSRVSGAWFKLVNDAKAAGVALTAISSFRSMPHQQSLWAQNPNTQLVARPGYSPHQAGVAIDFNNMSGKNPGASCATRATNSGAGYRWLRENAIKYGFKQYAAEAWHWDALPAANRCS